jgi:hypothetical protein
MDLVERLNIAAKKKAAEAAFFIRSHEEFYSS